MEVLVVEVVVLVLVCGVGVLELLHLVALIHAVVADALPHHVHVLASTALLVLHGHHAVEMLLLRHLVLVLDGKVVLAHVDCVLDGGLHQVGVVHHHHLLGVHVHVLSLHIHVHPIQAVKLVHVHVVSAHLVQSHRESRRVALRGHVGGHEVVHLRAFVHFIATHLVDVVH